jgi:site-specific recombinase XerD
LATLNDALIAYRICAKAEGKSPRTIEWITSSVGYFANFLGGGQDITKITANDLRRFIIALQESHKYSRHPYNRTQEAKLSPQSINTYCRAIRAFFGYLHREELTRANPIEKVKMPKAPQKVVPTLSAEEVERLLSQPDRRTDIGFRDFAILITFIDTAVRLSELAGLMVADVDLENGYLKVLGKGGRERYVPFGQKVAKALLKYRLKHRPKPSGDDWFWLTAGGARLTPKRIEKIVAEYGKRAGIHCYCHKLRHTSAIMYLRNGGDPFSLQKKLGHSSLAMTRHYSNPVDSDVRAAHLRYGVADRLNV